MNLLGTLTVRPLLYAIGALALMLLATGVGWYVDSADARSDLSVAMAAADSASASAQASRTRVSELQAANAGYADTVSALQSELRRAQDQVVTVRAQSALAIAAADARAADADLVLKTFLDRYAGQVKETHCAQALQKLEAACPAFSGY